MTDPRAGGGTTPSVFDVGRCVRLLKHMMYQLMREQRVCGTKVADRWRCDILQIERWLATGRINR